MKNLILIAILLAGCSTSHFREVWPQGAVHQPENEAQSVSVADNGDE